MRYPSGKEIDYAPNEWGDNTKASPVVTSATHWASGNPKTVTYANNTQTDWGQNDRRFVSSISTTGHSNVFTQAKQVNTYTDTGVLTRTFSYRDADDETACEQTGIGNDYFVNLHSYDGLNRLFSNTFGTVSCDGNYLPPGTVNKGYFFTYDAVGNISTNKSSQNLRTNYRYGYNYNSANNRLESITNFPSSPSSLTSHTFTYDVYGNITSNGTKQYTYNEASELIKVTGPSNLTEYEYDGNSRLVKVNRGNEDVTVVAYNGATKRLFEYKAGNAEYTDDTLTEYYYLDSRLIATSQFTELNNEDTDSDGIHDAYELRYGLDPAIAFVGGATPDDRDGDGLSDKEEFQYNTNAADADTDGDGVDDNIEIALGINPLSVESDGVNDNVEIASGRNPGVNEAVLMIVINSLLLN